MNRREDFLVFLMGYHRVWYKWGGDDYSGIDCSGFVQKAMAYLLLDPPGDQTADELMRHYRKNGDILMFGKSELGSLVFYGKNGKATHVTVALGNGKAIGANGGGSSCTTEAIAKQMQAYVKVHNINYRDDLLCIVRPPGLPWS